MPWVQGRAECVFVCCCSERKEKILINCFCIENYNLYSPSSLGIIDHMFESLYLLEMQYNVSRYSMTNVLNKFSKPVYMHDYTKFEKSRTCAIVKWRS